VYAQVTVAIKFTVNRLQKQHFGVKLIVTLAIRQTFY